MVKTAKMPAKGSAKNTKATKATQATNVKTAMPSKSGGAKTPARTSVANKTTAAGKSAAARTTAKSTESAVKTAKQAAAAKAKTSVKAAGKSGIVNLALSSVSKTRTATAKKAVKDTAKSARTSAAAATKSAARTGAVAKAAAMTVTPVHAQPAPATKAAAKSTSGVAAKIEKTGKVSAPKAATKPIGLISRVIAKASAAKIALETQPKRPTRAVPARVKLDASLRKSADTALPDSAPIRTASAKAAKAEAALDPNYRPTDGEAFMNERQREYFRRKLIAWKDDILRESKDTLAALQAENENHPDLADRASSETDRAIELRARDRQRKLIAKIDSAISRIEDGSYGYCEETGEPISLRRLEARPIATLSIEAQERHERNEKVHRDD